uniref:AAA_12 domain-containing protein n=1 Tax=Rhabditophanes sp. KR3021 TaxID=114890 RepID=A0AC35U3L1_9BILA
MNILRNSRIEYLSVLNNVQDSNAIPSAGLVKSYRMHSSLLKLVSVSYYGDTLESGVSEKDRQLALSRIKFPDKECPLLWIDTCKIRSENALFTSLKNEREGQSVLRMVKKLKKSGFKDDQIGIICIYNGQVKNTNIICKRLSNHKFIRN